ncbi:MAG: peptide protein [Ferruginibacter sp.]|nr:peptide protein [Ferruginibacter sp.]
MKKIQVYILLALLSLFTFGFKSVYKNPPNDIVGLYWSPKKDAKIEIYLKGAQCFGRFVWLSTPRKDSKNPLKAFQTRDIVGLEFLTGFSYDGTVYSGGEIYDPETGKTYSSKMSLEGNKLKVRGYIGISLFGRTEYFERIK